MMMPPIMMPNMGDATDPAQPQPNGTALLIGVAVGLVYWWVGQKQREGAERDAEEDDEDIDDDEIERPKRVSRLSDVTTDSLIDEPALVASSGKAGDCYKAVKMLPGRQSLARNAHEQSIFRRVLKSVADDCRGHEDAIEDALEDLEETRDEIEEILGADTSDVDRDPERMIAARHAAQKAVREGSLRKTRKKRVPREPEIDVLDRVSHSRGATSRGGRPRGASMLVRRPKTGEKFRFKKEKSSTKRGFKWRKEEV